MPLELAGKQLKVFHAVHHVLLRPIWIECSFNLKFVGKLFCIAMNFVANRSDYRLHLGQTSFAFHIFVQKIAYRINKHMWFYGTNFAADYPEAALICLQSLFTETQALPFCNQSILNGVPVDYGMFCVGFNSKKRGFLGSCQKRRCYHKFFSMHNLCWN